MRIKEISQEKIEKVFLMATSCKHIRKQSNQRI